MNEDLKDNSYEGTKIKAVPKPKVDIGIDTGENLTSNIIQAVNGGAVDLSMLESFLNISNNRESIYKLLDTMAQDSTVSAILETYAEDCVETNDNGKVVWVESADDNVLKYVTYLLDTMNIDKHIYSWVHALIKYGDLYLRLYRESDYGDDLLFSTQDKDTTLNENVRLNVHPKNDHYVHYLEAVANPGEMFELTKFGKTMGYVKAPTNIQSSTNYVDALHSTFQQYNVKRGDVDIFSATDFVHASLEDNSSRTSEEVNIFLNDEDYKNNERPLSYKVRRGQSLMYNTFRIWRELSLLENSVLLNRLTKSSIVRVISVEVGDMPKENIGGHLQSIKQLIEQKSAINTGDSMAEYTNPGPVENNIYVPTHSGVGAISTQQIGGDVDPKALTDLNYYRDKFFAAYRVPKQFFGFTDDAAGFNGGSSLSIISSRYGKAIKRIQNTMVQAITDAVNLMLLDKGLQSYINKFQLRMTAPLTQEEIDKRDNLSNRVRVVSDIMTTLTDITDENIKLNILKSLLSTVVSDSEIISLIQRQIDIIESQKDNEQDEEDIENNIEDDIDFVNKLPDDEEDSLEDNTLDDEELTLSKEIESKETSDREIQEESINESTFKDGDDYLPKPSELGIDFTDNNDEI